MVDTSNIYYAALTGLNKSRASSDKNMDGQLNPVIGYLVLKGLHKPKLIRQAEICGSIEHRICVLASISLLTAT